MKKVALIIFILATYSLAQAQLVPQKREDMKGRYMDKKSAFFFGGAGEVRDDIPITKRLRASMMINTDKEYMLGLRYIVNKYFSISTHGDSDMGLGAGLTITY